MLLQTGSENEKYIVRLCSNHNRNISITLNPLNKDKLKLYFPQNTKEQR